MNLQSNKEFKNNMPDQKVDPQDPVLAFSPSEKIGRVYRKPDTVIPEGASLHQIKNFIREGKLVPSTTNIIGVRSSPYLIPWASRVVAQAAVNMANNNPNFFVRAKANPFGAIDYFKQAPERERDFWGEQGSRIHLACELLAQQKQIPFVMTEYEEASVNEWKKWLDKFQPEFKFLEITGFGETKEDKLGYAHTTDVILDVNNKTVIGDYKCVTDDTQILMYDGSLKNAVDIKENDEVVAWDKTGLHTAKVSYVGDNGYHKVAKITTLTGHKLTTTLNHPYWSSRRSQKLGWVNAEDLQPGDEVYIAMGWNYSQYRTEQPWPFNKYLSPYLFGILWGLRNYKEQDWNSQKYTIEIPALSRETLKEELHESAFRFNKAGKMSLVKGLNKLADKNGITVEDVLKHVDSAELPDFLYSASPNVYYGFFAGIREVFGNKELSEEELLIILNDRAASNLQQMYTNHGQPANVSDSGAENLSFVKVPYDTDATIFTHGATPTRIADIEYVDEPQHTIAIEVAHSHTHVTGGLITHNTNRSGLHVDVGLQLAANARGSHLAVDNKELIEMPKIDTAIGIHISPKGVKTNRINIGNEVYDTFQSLRRVWDFQVFEGTIKHKQPVIQEEITSPTDI